ncbi:hypothetical protein EJ110_NYTH60117 [Nymphaea thermarum]|nr:hypothetical protein EJ110_NYTH60117 [Nymphaea thermarum]
MASPSMLIFPYPYTISVANFVSLKLRAENFLLWKTQILALIESQDLQGFLTGDVIAPSEFIDDSSSQKVPNPHFIAWRKTDRLIKGWITSTLSESALGLVPVPLLLLLHLTSSGGLAIDIKILHGIRAGFAIENVR